MEKVKTFFKSIWETKIGKLIASFVLAVISFALSDLWDFMYWVGCIFMLYPLGLFCVMVAYAWVINPIREWKENKKAREEASKEMTAGEIAEAIEAKPEPAVEPTPVTKNVASKPVKKTIKKVTTKKKTTNKNGKRRR